MNNSSGGALQGSGACEAPYSTIVGVLSQRFSGSNSDGRGLGRVCGGPPKGPSQQTPHTTMQSHHIRGCLGVHKGWVGSTRTFRRIDEANSSICDTPKPSSRSLGTALGVFVGAVSLLEQQPRAMSISVTRKLLHDFSYTTGTLAPRPMQQ